MPHFLIPLLATATTKTQVVLGHEVVSALRDVTAATNAAADRVDPYVFFEVSATIIPILFVGLLFQANVLEQLVEAPDTIPPTGAVERRLYETRLGRAFYDSRFSRAVQSDVTDLLLGIAIALGILFVTVRGEYVALHALSVRHLPGTTGRQQIAQAIAFGAATLVFQRLRPALDTWLARTGKATTNEHVGSLAVAYSLTLVTLSIIISH